MVFRLQILLQPGEGGFKGVLVFPVREVRDEILAQFHRQVLAGVRIPKGLAAQGAQYLSAGT